MKKKFKEPYINVYHFKMENIVTTSGGYTGTKLDSEDESKGNQVSASFQSLDFDGWFK